QVRAMRAFRSSSLTQKPAQEVDLLDLFVPSGPSSRRPAAPAARVVAQPMAKAAQGTPAGDQATEEAAMATPVEPTAVRTFGADELQWAKKDTEFPARVDGPIAAITPKPKRVLLFVPARAGRVRPTVARGRVNASRNDAFDLDAPVRQPE